MIGSWWFGCDQSQSAGGSKEIPLAASWTEVKADAAGNEGAGPSVAITPVDGVEAGPHAMRIAATPAGSSPRIILNDDGRTVTIRRALGGLTSVADREECTMSDEPIAVETRGVEVQVLASVELAGEIEGMEGRQLRMRMVTIEPGGVFGPVP